MRQSAASALALFLAATPAIVQAQAADPAAAQVTKFDEALLSTMRQAKQLGPKGRFNKLEPVISEVFDLPTMTRFAVGANWSTLSAADQQQLIKAFGRMTVATYAHNFDGYNGQKFVLDKVETRGPDKLVRTRLLGGDEAAQLTYRMRQTGGTWKVIDVYFNNTVSSLLGQRSEYAATLKSGGAPALLKKLDSHTADLLG
jgi:phospholipid transport system substrate-binding protein